MAIGPLSKPVIDTHLIPLARQDSQGPSSHNTPNHCTMSTDTTENNTASTQFTRDTYKQSIIPDHSSLPSPLSPPSVSPPSFGSSMADIPSKPAIGSSASLPPLHPSASPSPILDNNNTQNQDLTRATQSAPSLPFIQTQEAWLAHAAQQRRHLSTGSLSSIASPSSALLSPDPIIAQSPMPLEFGESERVRDGEQDNEDQEPELILNVRPSELRASLMARAKMSSAKLQQKRSESMPLENSSRLSGQSNQSLSSAYDSRLSTHSSISSSISGWTPRERSASVSSQGSNDSVNLDALIAEGSDINEECPLELEEADDVEWSKGQQQRQLQLQQSSLVNQPELNKVAMRSRSTTGASEVDMHDNQAMNEYWSDSEVPVTEEDEEFGETLREFSQLSMKSAMPEVRGLSLGGDRRSTVKSPRFPDGRNPFDLEADYADTPAGLRSGDRMSNISNYSNYSNTSSNRSSIGRLPAPSNSRLPASGLKAPSTRLAQPGTRSMLAQPKAKAGIARPSGLQTPKAGAQTPRSGLQLPRAASSSTLAARGSSIAKPGSSNPGRTIPSARTSPVDQRNGANPARPRAKSQMASPSSIRSPMAVTTSNRQSLLQAPSTSRIASTVRRSPSASTLTSPKRTTTAPNLLASPTRATSNRRQSASAYMVSPTSSHTQRETVASLSQRLSYATGTSQLVRPKTTAAPGRSISMYGSSSMHSNRDSVYQQYQQDYDERDYVVLTPPQSPSSSKPGSRMANGIPRSGIAAPSRLVAPTVSTSRATRAGSPSPLSAGSNFGSQGSFLPRPHTPSSSRIPSGLVSPRAGRY
ncbi:hypothetical protein BGX27_003074 [Mortierella sp. AM989]|nr:hypothetical protein BGX27_003074 [Mortierella sp. AM989]